MALLTVGLVLARTAVSLTLRVFVPILLTVLAVLFGPALRQAARRVADAGRRASLALDGAMRRVGRRPIIIDTEGEEVDSEAQTRASPHTRRGRARVRVEAAELEDDDDVKEPRARRHHR
jgi:hypothetical protein